MIFEFGRGFYGNTYISVLSMLTLTPTVPLRLRDEQLGMKSYQLLDLQHCSAVFKCLITPPSHLSDQHVFQSFPAL